MSSRRKHKEDSRKRRKLAKMQQATRRARKLRSASLYIDETGNTGSNLFDENQPLFICGGMLVRKISATRIDLSEVRSILGVNELHGSEVGLSRLEQVAEILRNVIIEANPFFLFSVIHKPFLVGMKFYDCLFDAGTNPGVSGFHCVSILFKYLYMLKFIYVLEEKDLHDFWKAYSTKDLDAFSSLLQRLRPKYEQSCLDPRGKELILDCLDGALQKPSDVLSLGFIDADCPNVISVVMFAHDINKHLGRYKCSITDIVHDRQDQFRMAIPEMFNAIKQTRMIWDLQNLYPEYENSAVLEGSLRMEDSEHSDPLQLIDTVLYIFKKGMSSDLHGNLGKLIQEIADRARPLFMTWQGIESRVYELMIDSESRELTPDMIEKGKLLMAEIDKKRKNNLNNGVTDWH